MGAPYRSTPVFDAGTLPAALRREHRTKAGVWGVIHVIEGTVMLHYAGGGPPLLLTPGQPGTVAPGQLHWVTPRGAFRLRIDFHGAPPETA